MPRTAVKKTAPPDYLERLRNGVVAHLQDAEEIEPAQAYVSLADYGPESATVHVWHADGGVSEYAMAYRKGLTDFAIYDAAALDVPDNVPRKRGEVQLNAATAASLVTLLLSHGVDPPAELALECVSVAAATLKDLDNDIKNYQVLRNDRLCELHYFHGWTSKSDLRDLVDISRSELDGAICAYTLANHSSRRTTGEQVVASVREYERKYRLAERQQATVIFFRDMLIRELRQLAGRYPRQEVAALAQLARVASARISQIANPDYRQKHAEAKRRRYQASR
uniref:hypothetical protein n=1 Tax=Nonomuraea sp. CA-251285 TaxID=3240002 RepID=UPI003F497FE9